MNIDGSHEKFFATQKKIIAALPSGVSGLMKKTGLKRSCIAYHRRYLKKRGLICISHYEPASKGPSCPVYALGSLPDAVFKKAPRRPKNNFVSAEYRRERDAEIAAERTKLQARMDADNARFWNFAPMEFLFKRQIPKGITT